MGLIMIFLFVFYVTSYTYQAGSQPPVLSHAFMFQIGLRTIAQTSTTSSSAGVQ